MHRLWRTTSSSRVPSRSAHGWNGLSPIKNEMIPPLSNIFREPSRPERERELATSILAEWAQDQPDVVIDLLKDASDEQYQVLFVPLAIHGERAADLLERELDEEPRPDLAVGVQDAEAKARAALAATLWRIGNPEAVLPYLRKSSAPRLRSELIHRFRRLGADASSIAAQIAGVDDVSIVSSLLLCLSKFPKDEVPLEARQRLIADLVEKYGRHPDPGLHGAIGFLLRNWGVHAQLREVEGKLSTGKIEGNRKWYLTTTGQTMIVVPRGTTFEMGATEPEQEDDEMRRVRSFDYSFAIASTEVTVAQVRQFQSAHPNVRLRFSKQISPQLDCPMNGDGLVQYGKVLPMVERAGRHPRGPNVLSACPGNQGRHDATG